MELRGSSFNVSAICAFAFLSFASHKALSSDTLSGGIVLVFTISHKSCNSSTIWVQNFHKGKFTLLSSKTSMLYRQLEALIRLPKGMVMLVGMFAPVWAGGMGIVADIGLRGGEAGL